MKKSAGIIFILISLFISMNLVSAFDYDVNKDGVVNIADLLIIRNNFGNYENEYDINGDENIDGEDLALIKNFFGAENLCLADVDESGTVTVLDAGAIQKQIDEGNILGCCLGNDYCNWADVNRDSEVNEFDIAIVRENFGLKCGDYLETFPDIDDNGIINIVDLLIVRNRFGSEINQKFDLNGDKKIDESDRSVIIKCIFNMIECEDSFDLNEDGIINNTDLMVLIKKFYKEKETFKSDLNGDGVIDGKDLVIVAAYLGAEQSEDSSLQRSEVQAEEVEESFDINSDGKINIADLLIIRDCFDKDLELKENSNCSNADLNDDGSVDAQDLIKIIGETELELVFDEPKKADIDGDGDVDLTDFQIFLAGFGKKDCNEDNSWCDSCDINHDGKVDFADFQIFREEFTGPLDDTSILELQSEGPALVSDTGSSNSGGGRGSGGGSSSKNLEVIKTEIEKPNEDNKEIEKKPDIQEEKDEKILEEIDSLDVEETEENLFLIIINSIKDLLNRFKFITKN